MPSAPRDELEQMAGHLNEMISKLWQWHAGDFCPVDTWSPSINFYRFDRRIEVCVDLAGVNPSDIDVHIQPGALSIRGSRPAPEPKREDGEPMRIETMEIDHGRFCRVVQLPEHVDLTKVESQYRSGMLWIRLPFRDPG
jgi:HSP20 family protein